jgi:hypothetical protein
VFFGTAHAKYTRAAWCGCIGSTLGKIMKYCVNVRVERSLAFPDLCPFTGEPSPNGTVKLERTRTLLFIPLLVAYYQKYQKTTLRIPASAKIARRAMSMSIMVWASLLGGIGICFLLLTSHSNMHNDRIALLCLVGSPLLALGFKIARAVTLRAVNLKSAEDGFVEFEFKSETYAREFSRLNNVSVLQN